MRIHLKFALQHWLQHTCAEAYPSCIIKLENRSLWTRAHLAFRLRTHNLAPVTKGDKLRMYDEEIMTNDDSLKSNLLTSSLL